LLLITAFFWLLIKGPSDILEIIFAVLLDSIIII
jgi:hypothetical protein